MLPDYYEFQNASKALSGEHALENIPRELAGLDACRPLLLSDRMLEKLGLVQMVVDALSEGDVQLGGMFLDLTANTSMEVVNEIAALYRKLNCDSLIALGGGAVMDTAKGAVMVLSQNTDDILNVRGCETLTRGNRMPFIAIPTTAGTGSEAAMVAVITDGNRGIKMEFISHHLVPDVAVLDPRMTLSLPPRITASTGMDALCHAVEAYTCLQKNPLSDAYAAAAIAMIRDNLSTAVKDGKNKKARLAMANAAYMAGAAFSNSMVGVVHAIGHALAGVCKIAHGDAMTILLPYGMEYNFDLLRDVYGELLLYLGGGELYAATPAGERGRKSIQLIREMGNEFHQLCGLPIRLSQLGVDKQDFDRVARTALNDGAIIVNPKKVDYEDVLAILEQAY